VLLNHWSLNKMNLKICTLQNSIEIWKHTAENTIDLVTNATLAPVMYVRCQTFSAEKAVLSPYGVNHTRSINSVELYLGLWVCWTQQKATVTLQQNNIYQLQQYTKNKYLLMQDIL